MITINKKAWVRQWLWILCLEGYLSRFDYDLYKECDNLEEWYEPLKECFEL